MIGVDEVEVTLVIDVTMRHEVKWPVDLEELSEWAQRSVTLEEVTGEMVEDYLRHSRDLLNDTVSQALEGEKDGDCWDHDLAEVKR